MRTNNIHRIHVVDIFFASFPAWSLLPVFEALSIH